MFLGAAITGCRFEQMSPFVSVESIRRVRIGMTERDLLSVLGAPLRKREAGGDEQLFDYAISGFAPRRPNGDTYSIWIGVKDGAVTIVHVERWPLIHDHYALYEARRDLPVYEHPEFAHALPTRVLIATRPK